MCIIEKKLYSYTDGRERTVESTKYCPRAVGTRMCNRIERRSVQQARIVERSPSTNDGPSTDSYIVTQGTGGRTRVYRDLSNRSSNSSSVRRSTTSERSPVSISSSNSSPPVAGTRTSYSPPASTSGSPSMERTRAPYPPLRPEQFVREDGTAVYDRPPSLEMPRATENERRRPPPRRPSSSSMTAEVDDSQPPSPPPQRRRPSVRIDTNPLPSSSTTPSVESPGLSRLPSARRSYHRRDTRPRNDSGLDRGREEEDRQARIERDRIAASDSRQRAREETTRTSSTERRERHRRAAADALEGGYQTQAQLAEEAQMARERAARSARDSADLGPYYSEEQLQADPALRAAYYSARSGPTTARPSSRRLSNASYSSYVAGPSSPVSARSSLQRPPLSARSSYRPPPIVHQQPSVSRRGSIAARGEDVIAREQARSATERLNSAMGGMSVEDRGEENVYEYEYDERVEGYVPAEEYDYYVLDDGRRVRMSRRRSRRHR